MATAQQWAAFRKFIPELTLGHTFNLTLAADTGSTYVGYDDGDGTGAVRDMSGTVTRNGQIYTLSSFRQADTGNAITFSITPPMPVAAMTFANEQIVWGGYPLTLTDANFAAGTWTFGGQQAGLLTAGNLDLLLTDSTWLDLAAQIHNVSVSATAFLAAHLATINTEGSGESSTVVDPNDGGDRVIVSERMGEQQVTYARTGASGGGGASRQATNEAFFQSTRYGRTYLQLARRASVALKVF